MNIWHMIIGRLRAISGLILCFLSISGLVVSEIQAQPDTSFLRPDFTDSLTQIQNIRVPDLPPTLSDTSSHTFKDKLARTLDNIQDGLPEIYEENKKTKLKIKFPWREDIVLPFPKGALPAPRPPPFDPTIAWQRALIIPTWGQIYNRRFWKVPIFLAGYGGAIGWASFNNQQYILYGNAYLCKVSEDPCDPGEAFQGLDAEGIRNRRNSFRQNRDYAVLGVIGWHLISVAEAFVDAHLRGFDVSEDLTHAQSWEIKPSLEPIGLQDGTLAAGIGIRLNF